MSKLGTKVIRFEDIKPGMIIQAKSASGSTTRKVYKTIDGKYRQIWSIVIYWGRNDDWVEECSMVSNDPERISAIWLLEDGIWVKYKLIIE